MGALKSWQAFVIRSAVSTGQPSEGRRSQGLWSGGISKASPPCYAIPKGLEALAGVVLRCLFEIDSKAVYCIFGGWGGRGQI